jgi:predicted nucleic acid-binding protein
MKGVDTKRFVLDASVTLAWCFEDESTKFTESVLDLLSHGAEAVVPSIWPLEVGNAMLVAERRKRIALAQATAILRKIAGFPIHVIPIDARQAFELILPRARQLELSEYDASYLDLALREGLPLATLDVKLRRSAHIAGVPLLSV